ncbi:MAG: 6-phosphofructokinase [Armatimonadetes bacterium]|nr:6-phosphofructokinase [Armatimonadota bacterium]MDW8120947.1 ATP-dependent 6-phosphofructokinase [Armatimonadota bacterium]
MKRIGVLTSGGDAPGMNACLRAIVRTASVKGLEVYGVLQGFKGLTEGRFQPMHLRSVSGIMHLGGTILKSSRYPRFLTAEARSEAAQKIREAGLDGLIAIGGNGTSTGAYHLWREHAIPILVCASTIDNDLYGTDFTIGFDTAVTTAVEAIDRIKDVAAAHDLIFFVEVMGRHRGFLALYAGLAGGCEEILLPEEPTDYDALSQRLMDGRRRGKTSSIVVVAEGDVPGGAFTVAEEVRKRTGLAVRVTVLGHIQRGGTPTPRDRILASRLGNAAVDFLIAGEQGKLVGEIKREIVLTPLKEAIERHKDIDQDLYQLSYLLSQ